MGWASIAALQLANPARTDSAARPAHSTASSFGARQPDRHAITPEQVPACRLPAPLDFNPARDPQVSGVRYRTESVDGIDIFFREAGERSKPTLVLLHGYPTSSHMYRDLIPLLSDKFHIIAPDYPGFGSSGSPSPSSFTYSFDAYSAVMRNLLDRIGVKRYHLYVQDYGGPVGFRMAAQNPERVSGLIVQNAPAYPDGLTDEYKALMLPLWSREAGAEKRILDFMGLNGTLWEYQSGVRDLELLSPDAWTHAQAILDRPGSHAIQMALRYDSQNNRVQQPVWHRYFREHKPPTLILWGKGDPLFGIQAANAYLRDLPAAKLIKFDTGHFALETHAPEIACAIRAFFASESTPALP
jgi:pimeloyl-ACP methyl ester carboxylesterase